MVGWKTYATRDTIEAPAFLVDALRRATPNGLVENATDLLIDPADGLRVVNEVDQLAAFEWAACQTSEGVRRVLTGLQPGMTERDCARLLAWNGAPLSCHLMLTAGPRASLGLLSPGDRPIERGDPFTIAFGIWGALNCRAGFVVEDASRAARHAAQDYVERLVAPYFEAVAEWYGALHVGQVGGELQRIADRHLGDPFFGVHLNPGHQLHLDEWVNSPVFPGSQVELRSGMALQCDIIPATGTPYFTTNIEDGVALADESLRAQLAAAYPGAWERIQARRRFMADALGIDLHADVLPLSNLAGHLRPFLLCPDRAMTARRAEPASDRRQPASDGVSRPDGSSTATLSQRSPVARRMTNVFAKGDDARACRFPAASYVSVGHLASRLQTEAQAVLLAERDDEGEVHVVELVLLDDDRAACLPRMHPTRASRRAGRRGRRPPGWWDRRGAGPRSRAGGSRPGSGRSRARPLR